MTNQLKSVFKSMPIEVTHDEYMILANTLYSSWQAMVSKNKMIHIIDIKNKKVYGFDEILEVDKIIKYAAKENHNLLQIIN